MTRNYIQNHNDARSVRQKRPIVRSYPGHSNYTYALNSGLSNTRTIHALQNRSAIVESNNGLYNRVKARSLPLTFPGDSLERATDRLASGRQNAATVLSSPVARLTSATGEKLPKSGKRNLEALVGNPLNSVRVHKDRESANACSLLRAEAFTHGHDIFLSERARLSDTALIAHEAAHAVQNRNVIQRCEATWFERRAWTGFFDHYLPKKFLNNYMADTADPITLTQQEMEDCNPVGVNIRRSTEFQNTLNMMKSTGGGSKYISCRAPAGAMTNGTLGNFTVQYDGILRVDGATGKWTFNGVITFIDFWDFNTSGGNRPVVAEAKVIVANALLPGQPFHIDSVNVPATQSNIDSEMQWTSAVSQHVPDNLVRGALDIGVGGDAGGSVDISTSPDITGGGLDSGAEAGAQTNADI